MLKHLSIKGYDLRITIYRSVKTILIAVIVALTIKCMFIDSISGSGEQMYPTIVSGDRLIIFRTPFLPLIGRLFEMPYDKPIAFKSITSTKSFDILRVAAFSNDTLRIDSGKVITQQKLSRINSFGQSLTETIPEEYAPRDFFNPYRIPTRGDLIFLNKLSLRDFFFTKSIIEQEHPNKLVSIFLFIHKDSSS